MIDFINEFISIFPSDGHNMTHKYRLLSSSRMFTRYFYYLYGYAESYRVEYKLLSDANVRKSTLAGIAFDNLLEIRRQRYLILDLRNNGGGTDEYGKLLFSYFIDHDFDCYSSLTMNKETYDFFKYTSRPDMKVPEGMLKANRNFRSYFFLYSFLKFGKKHVSNT